MNLHYFPIIIEKVKQAKEEDEDDSSEKDKWDMQMLDEGDEANKPDESFKNLGFNDDGRFAIWKDKHNESGP